MKNSIRYGVQLLKDTGLFKNIFGFDIKQSTIDKTLYEKIKTMGEFIYLLSVGSVENPAEFFKNNLKGDLDTYKEIKALELAFQNYNKTNPTTVRAIVHNMYLISPISLQSNILPKDIKYAASELLQGKYPKTVGELAVNGNDLMQIGLKGKDIGNAQKSLLLKIYSDKVANNKEDLLSLLNQNKINEIVDCVGEVLNENFLNRSKNNVNNFILSLKNFVIALKDILEFQYKIDFYKELLKDDLKSLKKNFKYTKNEIDGLRKDFKELFDEIDDDLINSLKLKKLYSDIIDNYDKENSIDINKKKINGIIDDYLIELDDYLDNTFNIFKTKMNKNKDYEALKNIDVARSKISIEDFEKEKYFLQIELLKLQEWVKKTNKRILIIFEGRDAAGKGATIKAITKYLDPKYARIETFGIPSKEESENWFDRYTKVLPNDGEIVFFDRSYYGRGYIQPVMEYCTDKQYNEFMNNVNNFEENLTSENIIVVKIWLSLSQDIQKLRFELRKSNPLKYWKFSENDAKTYKKWNEFTEYINKLLKKTDKIKWNIIDADDYRSAKIDTIKKILDSIDYEDKINDLINLDKIKKYNIIFLDIDGVLIPYQTISDDYHKYFDDEKKWSKNAINYMNKLVDKLNAKVVLISSQRKIRSKKEIEKKFKKVGLEFDIWDEIPNIKDEKRGLEIKKWLKENKFKIKNYVIIDDHRHDFPQDALEQYVVQPKSKIGFDKEDMIKAIQIIENDEKYNNIISNNFK